MGKTNKVHKKNEVVKALLKLNKVYAAADYEVKDGINSYLKDFIRLNEISNKKVEIETEIQSLERYLRCLIYNIKIDMKNNQTA